MILDHSSDDRQPIAEAADIVLPEPSQIIEEVGSFLQQQEDNQAIGIANAARNRWNMSKQQEIEQNRQFAAMADELSTAIINHLRTIPKPVAIRVGRKVWEATR